MHDLFLLLKQILVEEKQNKMVQVIEVVGEKCFEEFVVQGLKECEAILSRVLGFFVHCLAHVEGF